MMNKIEKFGQDGFYYCGGGEEFSTDGKAMVYRREGGPEKVYSSGERKVIADKRERALEGLTFEHEFRADGMMDVVGAFKLGKLDRGRVMVMYELGKAAVVIGDDSLVGRFAAEGESPLYLSVHHLQSWAPVGPVWYGEKAARWESVYKKVRYTVVSMLMRPDERDYREYERLASEEIGCEV